VGARLTLAELAQDCLELAAEAEVEPAALGLAISATLVAVDRRACSLTRAAGTAGAALSGVEPLAQPLSALLVGVVARSGESGHRPAGLAAILGPDVPGEGAVAGVAWHVHALVAAASSPLPPGQELDAFLATLDGRDEVHAVWHLGGASVLADVRAWLVPAREVRPGVAGRTVIDVEGDDTFREEWEAITRRVYDDASRVELVPLAGGYTSRAYRAASFDRSGRRQLPTVLKIAPTAVTTREELAYHNHVEKFILNNSTTIMGAATCGEWRGLRYNFLGINGAESRLTWIEDLYKTRAIDEVLALLERVVTDILKPWYGQPHLGVVHPFRDQVPSFSLFPNMLSDGERITGVATDAPLMPCPELGRDVPNPFHFLAHGYPARRGRGYTWYTGTVHGDLNLKNILVDERENLYVIDFSETRIGNVAIDFARIEPIVTLELTRIESAADVAALVGFFAGLAQARTLAEQPPFVYRGDDPEVAKAHRMICRLRHWADTVTLFETSLVPYLVSLLEWTYPIVSYWSVGAIVKRAAVINCALIVEQVLALEKEARS